MVAILSLVRAGANAALVLATTALSLSAHGGQYRGPGAPGPGVPGIPGRPAPGMPTMPGPGTPTTGSVAVSSDETSWQVWWEFNKDEFLQVGGIAELLATTGDDDFYIGPGRTGQPVDTLQPTTADVRDRIVPALAQLLERDNNRDVQSACAIALGKLGADAPGFDLEKALAALLARSDQEVRESAVLALGIAGRDASLPLLVALLRDQPAGRKAVGREQVGDRTRAFAAYGLGLMARQSADPARKTEVRDALLATLQDKAVDQRDLRVAIVNGLGVLVADPDASAHKRLAWETAEWLEEFFRRDLGRGEEAVQAQAAVAIGRLLGRGDSQVHLRMKETFVAELDARKRRGNAIQQAAVLALGMLCQSRERTSRDGPFSDALQQFHGKGVDQLARHLAGIALGRIGGETNRAWLLEAFARGNRYIERPWLALALGLQAAQAARTGTPDEALARLLLGELDSAKSDAAAALAVAIGLTGRRSAVPALLRQLRTYEADEVVAGYTAVGLALLGDPSTASTLTAVMERSKRRPFLLQQSAIALGRVGDRQATERLLAMLRNENGTAVLAAVASAIGQIGDRRAIDRLIELTRDAEVTKLGRAFVAAALGGVGDRRIVPWNEPLSRDSRYGEPVDTLTNGSTGVLDIL
ncbi:MAG: HEAT repeat domain-containing protein [Planctomycetes bacterium]|nr:HEAT repeat domain-containing protein [Planctomycetota bacterium]